MHSMTQLVTEGTPSKKAKAAGTFVDVIVLFNYKTNYVHRLSMVCRKGLWSIHSMSQKSTEHILSTKAKAA